MEYNENGFIGFVNFKAENPEERRILAEMYNRLSKYAPQGSNYALIITFPTTKSGKLEKEVDELAFQRAKR